jgi:hypothetical protein
MSYGSRPYGALGFGEQPTHDPPLIGSNSKGNATFGRYPYGGFKERGADSIIVSGSLESDTAQLAADVSASIIASGGLLAASPVVDGVLVLPPALSFASAIAAEAAAVDAAGRMFIAGSGALAPDADMDGAVSLFIESQGALLAGQSELDGDLAPLIAASAAINSGTSSLSADVLVFRRRRTVQAIAY